MPIISGPAGMDPILGRMRTKDIQGGTASGNYTFNSAEFTVGAAGLVSLNQVPSSKLDTTMDIVNVTGTSVTLQPNTAYKIYATSQAITLNANPPAAGKWAYESHIELFVAGTGYVVTGSNVVLANALEPDAVNNCTVRFHNGLAIISVEDHVAGYIVTLTAGTGEGSLPYALSVSSSEYVAFDATTNGQTLDLAGATTYAGEKHVVGNGYAETAISGGITCTSKTTFSNLTMLNVTNSGGTMTLGDTYIPSGSTVAVSGGGLAVEKVTGAGSTSVIDLGGANVDVSSGTTASASSVTFTSGSAGSDTSSRGGAFHTYGGTFMLANCTVSGNGANGVVGGGLAVFAGGSAYISNCTVSGNTGIGDIYVAGASSLLFINGGTYGKTVLNVGKMEIAGQNTIDTIVTSNNPGTVILTSGAILDLTGNTNATPINPGGGITFEPGGATVLYGEVGSVSSMFIDNLKPMEIRSGGVVYTSSGDMTFPNSAGASAVISGGIISGGRILNKNGGVLLVKDATVNNQLVVQNLGGAGTIKLAGTLNLTLTSGTSPIVNTQISVEGKTWDGVLEIASNTTITADYGSYLALGIGTLIVGSGVTVNGNPVSSGTFTSASLNRDGTITEA